jgi:hypothetical protein
VSHRVRLVCIFVGVLALAGSAAVQRASAAPPPLMLNVNANGALEVVLGNGTHLRTSSAPGAVIPPGPYLAIVASDVPDSQDSYHMFHLFGPGVNLSSELLPCENPAPVNTVTLQPSSTYTYEDSRHPDLTHVVFTTSASGSSADTAGAGAGPATAKSTGAVSNSSLVGSAVKKVRGTLVGSISSVGKATLSLNGKTVSSLKPGRYKLTVDDRTPNGGFAIAHGSGRPVVVTAPSFVGRHTVTVYLSAGRWAFSSSAGAKHAFVVVA